MARKTRASLTARLCILTTGTLLVVLIGVGHLAMSEQRSALIEQKKASFDAMTRALSLSASQLAAGTDRQLRDTVASRIKNPQTELKSVVISDSQGRTVFAESKSLPKKPYSRHMRSWFVLRRILGYPGINPQEIHSVSVPVMIRPGRAGTFTAGFTLSGAKEMLDAVQARALLGLALGLIVGILCAVVMGRSMSSALRSLIQGAKAVSVGNFSFRAANKRPDEIGYLTEAFNCMVESLASSQEMLVERANTDSLTGLYNHRHFQERLAAEVSRAARYGHNLSLIMIDIDFFKSFNDAHGHPMGDAVLRDLAQLIIQNIRETDVAVRYGGEEFAVILPETRAGDAAATAERIRQEVQKQPFCASEGLSASLTVSVGVAEYPSQCSDRTSLVTAADIALYQAKALGRNRVSCYDTDQPGPPQADPYKLYVLLHAHDLPTIEALAEAIDAKLKFPSGHSRAVARLASATATSLGMSERDAAAIYLAALLRDIGQIAVPDAILAKAGTLTEEEVAGVSSHPNLGHAIVQKAPHLSSVLPAILHHHEHFDGAGYPSGASGQDIPLPARIIAVADAYQSMTTSRPHRRRMSPGEARTELVEKSARQFDPKVVQAFLEVLASGQPQEQAA